MGAGLDSATFLMSQLSPIQQTRLTYYLNRWLLTSEGPPILTNTSLLQPVYYQGLSAMLKIAQIDEEQRGNRLMAWYAGDGAAQVLAWEEDALLLERATEARSLADLVSQDQDDAASGILCEVAARLHKPRSGPLPDLVPLTVWFRSLESAAYQHEGILSQASATANQLLSSQQDIRALHGDLHHQNVLYFGQRGWLAIDPKGALGERAFDFAALFGNPDPFTATSQGRFARQLNLVAEVAALERRRLAAWVLAWAGLSAAWSLEDREDSSVAFAVMHLAAAELTR